MIISCPSGTLSRLKSEGPTSGILFIPDELPENCFSSEDTQTLCDTLIEAWSTWSTVPGNPT